MNPPPPRFTGLCLFLLLLAAGISARALSETDDALIVNDPEVRHGVLSNGLAYYVRENSTPSGMAELRLAVRAGSALEDDDQLGLAHFVEHMLFNGTRKYPGNGIVDVLESFGMEFGPEINAYTTYEHTVYRLSVSSENRDEFLTGLEVLEEWAFNATLDEDQFEDERPIIHEEWRVRRGAQARMRDETSAVLFKGARYAERRPIGDMEIVLNAPVEALRRFYTDWYRPDLMAVIAVGDFDPDQTVALIAERFGPYKGPPNPRPRPEYPIPRHDETLLKVVHDPEATRTMVQFLRKFDSPAWQRRSELIRELSEDLFLTMLNQRFEEIGRTDDSPFLGGYGFSNKYNKDTSIIGVAAAAAEEKALEGLAAILSEAQRVDRFGFLPSELERAKTDLMSFFENYWKQRNDMDSGEFAGSYLDAYLKGDFFPSVDWQWRAVQDLLPLVTLDEAADAGARLLEESNRVVLVTGPSVPAITGIREEEILHVIKDAEQADLAPWEDNSITGPLVRTPPPAGRIVERSAVAGTDIEQWTLSNGARVVFKATDFKTDEILFRAISHGGASLVNDSEYVSSRYAVDSVSEGGVGEFSAADLRKVLTGKNVSVQPFLQESYEGFTGSSTPEDLETLFQLIYLYHSAPRRDREAWEALMTRTKESLRNRESSPTTLYQDLLWETIYDNHFRSRPITMDRLEEAELDEALRIFADRFRSAGDFTYVFVGDLDSRRLEDFALRWLAGLPGPASDELWRDRGFRNRSGTKEVSLEAGAEPLSVVTQAWLGEWDGSFAERYRIQSLTAALEMKLTKTIREEYGGTYSVGVFPHLSVMPVADYRIIVRYSCAPDRVDELTDRVLEIAGEWKSSLPEPKFSDDIVANQRRSLAENLERNEWWMGQIFFAAATGADPGKMMNREALYDTMSTNQLMESARMYLNDENYVEAVLYPDSVGQ